MRGPVGGIDRPPAVMPLDRRKVSLISEFLEESFVGCSVYDYEDKDRVAQSYRIINDTTGTVLHHVFVPREVLDDHVEAEIVPTLQNLAPPRVSHNGRSPTCHCEKPDDRDREGRVIVDYYRDHRIDVNAVSAGDRWNAEVRIRRTLSPDKPHVDTVTCYKLRPDHAEHSALIWAQRWIDLQKNDGPKPARQ
jgi:hypothetical protein